VGCVNASSQWRSEVHNAKGDANQFLFRGSGLLTVRSDREWFPLAPRR
jgi:hypothetical protein